MEKIHSLIETYPGFWQFFKYAAAGGVGTVINVTLFYVFSWKLFPALKADDWFVTLFKVDIIDVEDSKRSRNAMLDNFCGFLVANAVVYALSIMWIFETGKHHWLVEIALFYAVSGISVVLGTGMMGWLIRRYGMMTTYAFCTNFISALLINFAARKYFIFKG